MIISKFNQADFFSGWSSTADLGALPESLNVFLNL